MIPPASPLALLLSLLWHDYPVEMHLACWAAWAVAVALTSATAVGVLDALFVSKSER
jgi:hypothetical protein